MYKTVRISEFLHRRKETVFIKPDVEYDLVTVKMHHKGVVLREKKRGSQIGSTMFRISKGQFILSGIDARNGAFGVVPDFLEGAIITNDFWCFDVDEAVVKRDFFYWLTNTPLFLDACIKSSKGETQRVRLQKDLFFDFEFSIPSIDEQGAFLRRIEMANRGFVELNYELLNQSDNLTMLRQTLLKEAIEGKLTAEWRKQNSHLVSGDNHAIKIVEKIRSERNCHIKDGKIRKEEPLLSITDDDKPFALPNGWAWCRLGEISKIERGISPEYCVVSDYRILNQKCVRWNRIEPEWSKPILTTWFKDLGRENLTCVNDVLVNSTGEGTIGRSGIITSEMEGFPFDTHVLRISPSKETVPEFLMYFINSIYGQAQVSELKGAKTTKQTELGVGNLRSFIFPVAPKEEQRIIVNRVNGVLARIDEMENQVFDRTKQVELLKQSVLREVFEHSHA